MKRHDLLAAVVAVEPGYRDRDPGGIFAVEGMAGWRAGGLVPRAQRMRCTVCREAQPRIDGEQASAC
jgi:hypothetical protein